MVREKNRVIQRICFFRRKLKGRKIPESPENKKAGFTSGKFRFFDTIFYEIFKRKNLLRPVILKCNFCVYFSSVVHFNIQKIDTRRKIVKI